MMGYYTSFWRLILRYPELLAWEHLYHESVRDLYRHLARHVKQANSRALFGPQIWHNFTMSPIYRAEQDFAEMAPFSDFIKIAVYNNSGGPRLASYVESVAQTLYGDIPSEDLLRFHYHALGYSEGPLNQLRERPLSEQYVHRETKRAAAALAGTSTRLLAGIDVDIPVREDDLGGQRPGSGPRCTRESVAASTTQALLAGANGIVISRKYSEMRLETLSGVGDAVRAVSPTSGQ
jgi:hypothetical protein